MDQASRLNGEHSFATIDPQPARVPDVRRPAAMDAASLGARLTELLSQETPDDLLQRLGEFKRSVHAALARSSTAYQILRQLEDSGLRDCARCTRELEERLAGNPHYLVLGKIEEAEKLVADAIAGGR
jgi:hypothetical protein